MDEFTDTDSTERLVYDENANNTSIDSVDSIDERPAQRRGIGKNYIFVESFENLILAKEKINNDVLTSWKWVRKTNTDEGEKIYYGCKSKGCFVASYLLCHSDNLKVSLFESENEHSHDSNLSDKGIPEITKSEIKKLYENGVKKPNLILRSLANFNVPIPSKKQLNNLLAYYKKTKYGLFTISIGQLKDFAEKHMIIPEDQDCFYVGNYDINHCDDSNEMTMRIFFTSKRLIALTNKCTHVATDPIYKLVWQGYPVIMIGSTDMDKQFHPFGLAICMKERKEDFVFCLKA